jgi:hypothetical protein
MFFFEMSFPGKDQLAISRDVVSCFYFDPARVAFFPIMRDPVEENSNSPLVFNSIILRN